MFALHVLWELLEAYDKRKVNSFAFQLILSMFEVILVKEYVISVIVISESNTFVYIISELN